jgi:O-antigen ligase
MTSAGRGGHARHAPRTRVSLVRTVLATAILAGAVLPAEACTLVYGLLALPLLLRQGMPVERRLVRVLTPLALFAVLGAVMAASRPGRLDAWAFAQDAWRALEPIVLLAIGFAAVRSSGGERPFPQQLAAIGLAYASIYLLRLAYECLARGVAPLELADVLVVGHFPEALTLGICMHHRVLGARPSRAGWIVRRAAFTASALALALSGSRTWVLVGLVMLLAGAGWLRGRGRWRAVALTGSVLIALLATPIGPTLFTKGLDAALSEIEPARYTELGDIHERWRGYESWRALEAFAAGTPLQRFLGQGFGAKAELGLTIELAGVDFHEIGQFHNGWLWVLLKAGCAGVGLVLLWYGRLVGLCRALAARGERAAADLCLGVVLASFLAMLTVAGPFNPLSSDSLVLVLGGFLALAARRGAPVPEESRR